MLYRSLMPLDPAAVSSVDTRLDAAGVPSDHVCIAALAPKMLELAGRRTAGTHPYLVTPQHSAVARAAVGPENVRT